MYKHLGAKNNSSTSLPPSLPSPVSTWPWSRVWCAFAGVRPSTSTRLPWLCGQGTGSWTGRTLSVLLLRKSVYLQWLRKSFILCGGGGGAMEVPLNPAGIPVTWLLQHLAHPPPQEKGKWGDGFLLALLLGRKEQTEAVLPLALAEPNRAYPAAGAKMEVPVKSGSCRQAVTVSQPEQLYGLHSLISVGHSGPFHFASCKSESGESGLSKFSFWPLLHLQQSGKRAVLPATKWRADSTQWLLANVALSCFHAQPHLWYFYTRLAPALGDLQDN